MIRFIGIVGTITIPITVMVIVHIGPYHSDTDGVIQDTDGVIPVTDGDTLDMDGVIILPTTVVVGGVEATILLITPVIHRTQFILDEIIPTDKEDLPTQMLTEVVEADLGQE